MALDKNSEAAAKKIGEREGLREHRLKVHAYAIMYIHVPTCGAGV